MLLAELYALHQAALIAFFRRRLHDEDGAREAAQETFLRALAALPSLRREERAAAWLFGIARHVLHEIWRRGRRPAPPPPPPGTEDTPESLLSGRELSRRLEIALLGLPEQRRAALVLRARDQLDYRAIAARLRWPRAKVKNEIHRARLELAGALA
jgi:RNA polymerase sigma-70 factor (ECF subfamily)